MMEVWLHCVQIIVYDLIWLALFSGLDLPHYQIKISIIISMYPYPYIVQYNKHNKRAIHGEADLISSMT